eukprot:scaffold80784_cov27-Prasinocladus_malaysianus.AAC.1
MSGEWHQRCGMGRGRAAFSVHGELVLRPQDPLLLCQALRLWRAPAGGDVSEAPGSPHLPQRQHDAAPDPLQVKLACSMLDLELHSRYVPGRDMTVYDVDQKWYPKSYLTRAGARTGFLM